MEIKELKIQAPEGYEIDKEKSTFEKIVFKKKDNKPRSWEEYCKNYKGTSFFINTCGTILPSHTDVGWNSELAKNLVPSKELAKAFLAMMQLMSMRQEWIGNWEPDWNNDTFKKWCIVFQKNKLKVDFFIYNALPLSFPTEEMATDFMNCFEDLLEIAKPLI